MKETKGPDLIERLRWHAMDQSNLYRYLTAEAAAVIEEQDREIIRLRALLDEHERPKP